MTEFEAVFQLSKTIVFEVRYYTLGNNRHPYFSTSASQFCRSKRDWASCGQGQGRLLKGHTAARNFWEKWDVCHLRDLTPAQYEEMRADLERLQARYNHMIVEYDGQKGPYIPPAFRFRELAEWSKQPLKK